jgi:RNA polymerase sigma-70 factor (ECF subfamily)
LPERQKLALELCSFQDRTNIEAAEILGVSVEAVESLLARARRTLKTVLLEESRDLLIDGFAGAHGGET